MASGPVRHPYHAAPAVRDHSNVRAGACRCSPDLWTKVHVKSLIICPLLWGLGRVLSARARCPHAIVNSFVCSYVVKCDWTYLKGGGLKGGPVASRFCHVFINLDRDLYPSHAMRNSARFPRSLGLSADCWVTWGGGWPCIHHARCAPASEEKRARLIVLCPGQSNDRYRRHAGNA